MKFSFDRTFYYSALLFAFTLPLSRAAVSFFIFWFILLFLGRGDYRQAWERIKGKRVFHVMGAFLAFMALSYFWSSDSDKALNLIRLYGYWVIIPVLAVSLKKEWLSDIITAFLAGMFVSEVIAYGIFFELWVYNGRTSEYPSPIMSHIHYSIFLATTSVILLSRLLSDRYSWRSKLPMALFFLTSTGNLMLSTGRTGQLAFFVAMGVATVYHYRFTLKSFAIFIILSTAIFAGAYSTIDLFQKRINKAVTNIEQLKAGNYHTSWGSRVAFWIITYDIIREHPLAGAGIGGYESAVTEALHNNKHGFNDRLTEWCQRTHFHNQYLMILAQGGLIGFALMIWLLIELFKTKITNNEMKEFSILGLTVFVVSCIAEPLWMLQFPIILFVFIVSISLAAVDQTQPKQAL